MKRVVITGGAGFIGSHLAEELARRGNDVIILDDLSTGRRENLVALADEPSTVVSSSCHSVESSHHFKRSLESGNTIVFICGSINDLPLLQELFRGVDYVFHQAAIPSVPRSIENPVASHQANTTGTLNVLVAARDNGIKKVVYASSSSVYGDTPTLPKREDMFPRPQSPYAASKLAGEYYCQVFHQVYGLSTVCLRYFNVYGPRQNPQSLYAAVIPRFIGRLSHGIPPIIFGDGKQTRDFTFVKDVVEANILAAESDASGVFNIGTGESISINRLAEVIIVLTGSKDIAPIHQESRPGDIKHSLASITKAKSFGYNPKYTLEEGLSETVRRFSSEA